jgi:hypothetical protein
MVKSDVYLALSVASLFFATRADAACIAVGNAYHCGWSYEYPYPYDYYERFLENSYLGYPVGYLNPFSNPGPGWYRKHRYGRRG